jgi:hypothetical protein
LFTEHKKRLLNRGLKYEPTTHSGYDKHERPPVFGFLFYLLFI